MEHQFKKREEELLKMVDDAKEKVLVEIRCKAEAKRQRDLEDTLEDFMARVKRQAPMAAAFPNIIPFSHVPRIKSGNLLPVLLQRAIVSIILSFVVNMGMHALCKMD